MGVEILTDYKTINKEEWWNFVLHHPQGNIFQSPFFFDLYQQTPKHEPFVICGKQQGAIVGLICGVVITEYNGVLGSLTARAIIQGGPLLKEESDTRLLEAMTVAYDKAIKKKVVYSQVRNFFDTSSFKNIFESQGFVYEEHLNILVDLTKTEEELWKDVHSKRRNEIRRAYKEGTSFQVFTTPEALKEGYEILKEVYLNAKLPLPELGLFANALALSDKNAGIKVFTAIHDGKIIGVLIGLYFNNTIYDWYAGAYRQHYNKNPNDMLPWEVFRWGRENNYRTFDFGGAGKPNVAYGVRDYKMKFGGTFVNFGRYEKIHKKGVFMVAKTGFRAWQLMKGLKSK